MCRPPDCSGQSALTGERLERPRKLVLLFLFSFELDVLEIALREQQDLVDKIFLVESSATHRGVRIFHNISDFLTLFFKFQMSKPLLWETVRLEERFSFVNSSKLVHVVVDDRINENWKLYEW